MVHHIDLSDPEAAEICLECGSSNRAATGTCGDCGAPLVEVSRIRSEFDASAVGDAERMPALFALELLCVARGDAEIQTLRRRLQEEEEPYFLFSQSASGDAIPENDTTAADPVSYIYLAAQDMKWARETFPDLFDGGPSVLLINAGSEAEAATARAALDARGIPYSTSKFNSQFALNYGVDGETHFFVLQMDLDDARQAVAELIQPETMETTQTAAQALQDPGADTGDAVEAGSNAPPIVGRQTWQEPPYAPSAGGIVAEPGHVVGTAPQSPPNTPAGEAPATGADEIETELEEVRIEWKYRIARWYMYLTSGLSLVAGLFLILSPGYILGAYFLLMGGVLIFLTRFSHRDPELAFGSACLLFGFTTVVGFLTMNVIGIGPGILGILAVYFAYRRAGDARRHQS